MSIDKPLDKPLFKLPKTGKQWADEKYEEIDKAFASYLRLNWRIISLSTEAVTAIKSDFDRTKNTIHYDLVNAEDFAKYYDVDLFAKALSSTKQLFMNIKTIKNRLLNEVIEFCVAHNGSGMIVAFGAIKSARQLHLNSNICHKYYKESGIHGFAPELGYLYTLDEYRGQGIQKEIAKRLIASQKATSTNASKAIMYSTVVEDNIASIKVLESAGMQLTTSNERFSKVYPDKKILLYTTIL